MTEYSYFWGGSTVGDALNYAPIDAIKFSDFLHRVFCFGNDYIELSGASGLPGLWSGYSLKIASPVLSGQLNELVPSWAGGTFTMGSGYALVDGHIFKNDANATVAMAAPGAGTYYYIGGVFVDTVNQTIRLGKIGPATNPALLTAMVCTHGANNYCMAIACVEVTSGGVGTVIDVRRFLHANGDKVPVFIKRQGGSASDWRTAGNTAYDPDDNIMMYPQSLQDDSGGATGSLFLPDEGVNPPPSSEMRFESSKAVYIAQAEHNATPVLTWGFYPLATVHYLDWATYDGSAMGSGPIFYILAIGQGLDFTFNRIPNVVDPIV